MTTYSTWSVYIVYVSQCNNKAYHVHNYSTCTVIACMCVRVLNLLEKHEIIVIYCVACVFVINNEK